MRPVTLLGSTAISCREIDSAASSQQTRAGNQSAFSLETFKPHSGIPLMKLRRMDRGSRLACSAALELQETWACSKETGIYLGTYSSGSDALEEFLTRHTLEGPLGANPMVFPNTVLNAPAGHMAIQLGWQGPNSVTCQNFLAGLAAIQAACLHIHRHPEQVLVAGAVDILTPLLHQIWRSSPWLARGYEPGEGCVLFHCSTRPGAARIIAFSQGRDVQAVAHCLGQRPEFLRGALERHWLRHSQADHVWEFRPAADSFAAEFAQIYPQLPHNRHCLAGEVGFASFLAPYHLHQARQISGSHDILALGLAGEFLVCRMVVD